MTCFRGDIMCKGFENTLFCATIIRLKRYAFQTKNFRIIFAIAYVIGTDYFNQFSINVLKQHLS